MKKLCKKYPSIHYLNLESDTSYVYDDFFNETHLSEIGAEKFTRRLSDYVKEFISEQNEKISHKREYSKQIMNFLNKAYFEATDLKLVVLESYQDT